MRYAVFRIFKKHQTQFHLQARINIKNTVLIHFEIKATVVAEIPLEINENNNYHKNAKAGKALALCVMTNDIADNRRMIVVALANMLHTTKCKVMYA